MKRTWIGGTMVAAMAACTLAMGVGAASMEDEFVQAETGAILEPVGVECGAWCGLTWVFIRYCGYSDSCCGYVNCGNTADKWSTCCAPGYSCNWDGTTHPHFHIFACVADQARQ